MAFQYYLYSTSYNNTLVERSDNSFAPLPPNTGEIYSDFFIPEIQPLYYYCENSGLIVLNTEANISEYLQETTPPPESEDSVPQYQFTGYTDNIAPNTFLRLNQTTPQLISGGSPQFDGISFNTSSGLTHNHNVGDLHWNSQDKTLEIGLNSDVLLQIGQEQVYEAFNNTGVDIPNGSLISIVDDTVVGSTKVPTIELADIGKNPRTLGMTTQEIPHNSFGFVTITGKVRGLNTNGYSGGTILYLSTDIGEFTSTPPPAPDYVIPIGIVLIEDSTEGVLLFAPKFGYKISDMADVSRSGVTTTGQILTWDSALGYYRNDRNINEYLLSSVFSGYTGNTTLQTVTEAGSITNIETTFNSGIITNRIKPTGDTVTGVQITKANGTAIINVNTVSGMTGFGTNNPESLVHMYGTDTCDDSPLGLQTNGIRIDGVAGADKDIQWAENGVVHWLAQTYRNENAKFWYLYNQMGDVTPLVVSDTGRIGINNPTNIVNKYGLANINSGLDDIRFSGLYDKNFVSVFEIEIDGVGTPDTFRWRVSHDEGHTFDSWISGVNVSTDEILLESGVNVYFLSETGHTINTTWEKPVFPQLPHATFAVHPNGFNEILLTDDYGQGTIEYRNYTGEFNSSRDIVGIPILKSGDTLGAFYVGSSTKLNAVFFNFNSGGDGILLVTEYWNGTNWVDISVGNDGYLDDTHNLTQSGGVKWGVVDLVSWIRADIQDFETDEELFWIRFRSASSVIKQPVLNNVGRNGKERFVIYGSPYDYTPSFYVDLLGRTNIGGGAITRKNKLQISTVDFLDVAVGSASLVEMDSNDACAADLRIKLTSNDACSTGIAIVKTRGELTAADGVETGDELGHIWFRSRVANTGVTNNSIVSEYTGTGLLGSYDGDLIFNTATNSNPTEKVRITAIGNTGFGITPTAVIHLKAGTTSTAPLKFTSGTLLGSPQAGAVEFLGNNYYGTTTGDTRKTFAFLESPEFSGTPKLPTTTELNGINLNNYIWNSGGTNNPSLTQKSDFDAFTGSTVPWNNIDFSGSTLADIETRNAVDVDISVPHWNSYNVDDFTDKIANYIEDTQGSGRLSPEVVLSGNNTNNLIIFSGTGYITYSHYHNYVTWSATSINVSGYTDGTYYVYVDINQNVLITQTKPNGIDNINLGQFYVLDGNIGTLQQCGCIILNTIKRSTDFAMRLGAFIYDNGGSVNIMSGNTQKIVSSAAKVQYGYLDIQLSELTSNDVFTQRFGMVYASADYQVNTNYYFITGGHEGRVPTIFWNDVTKNSYVPYIGYTVTFTSGSTAVTSPDDLTAFITSDNLIYLDDDGEIAMNRVTGITWTGSETQITLRTPYIGSGGTGVLVANYALPLIPAGKWVKYLVARTTDNQMAIIPSQAYYDSEEGAKSAPLPLIPPSLNETALKMANIVFEQGESDLSGKIYDIRPLPFYSREGGVLGSGAVVTNHGDLSGLENDDHLQYLRTDGTRLLTGIQKYQSHPTFSSNTDLVDKKYVDDVDGLKLNTSAFNTFTGTTAPNTYLSIGNFNTYSGQTLTNINGRLLTTTFNTFTGTTAPATYANRASFELFTGTTAPNTYLSINNFNTYSGATNTKINSKASLSGATFTGAVYGLSAAVDSNTTQFATTAFVVGQASAVNPLMNGSVAIGTSLRYSRQDHVHPSDTSRVAKAGDTMSGALVINSNLTVAGITILGNVTPDVNQQNFTVIDTTTKKVADSGLKYHVYGSEYQLASDLTSTSTNSLTPVNKLTMTTTNLPAGTYKVTVHWLWGRNSASNSAAFDVTLNGVTQGTMGTMLMEAGDTTDDRPETRIFYLSLSGVNTIVFRHWGESTSNSTTTSDATIELIRVA